MRRHKEGGAGRLRLGMSTTTLTHLAGPALRQLRVQQPTLQLSVTIQTSPKLADLVRDNDLDLAVVTLPIDEASISITPLLKEDLVAILPKGGAAAPKAVTAEYLAEQPFIVDNRLSILKRAVGQWFQDAAVEPSRLLQLEHLEAIKGAVAAGLGASIVPQLLVRTVPEGIVVAALQPRLTRDLVVIQRRDAKANPAATAFLEALRRSVP
jgi:DNA-binding transcriptional LysR family regulator